jgi:hypothetical protein
MVRRSLPSGPARAARGCCLMYSRQRCARFSVRCWGILEVSETWLYRRLDASVEAGFEICDTGLFVEAV